MANIFDSIRKYAGSWELKSERAFSAEEISAVKEAYVVPSQYGTSACFIMKSGEKAFIPMSRDSSLGVGEYFKLEEHKIQTLSKSGESDIQRVL